MERKINKVMSSILWFWFYLGNNNNDDEFSIWYDIEFISFFYVIF